MKPHGIDNPSDWSESFDDMDGEAWEEHFALFEPPVTKGAEARWMKSGRRMTRIFSNKHMLRIWNLSSRTAALGDLADNECRITVHCRACNHHAVLNPHYLLEKLPDTTKVSEIGARLRCRKCGARSANTSFDPDGLNL